MEEKLLSICIPTFKRAAYLDSLLSSIYKQKEARSVEVIVSDNASPDATRAVVKKYPSVIYHRNKINLGFDANLQKVFTYATAKYCWFLGDDDAMEVCALSYILANLKDEDVYLTSLSLCNKNLEFLENWQYLAPAFQDGLFALGSPEDKVNYLNAVRGNAGLFGYIGGFIFKREIWPRAPLPSAIDGLGWAHVYLMWSALLAEPKTARYLPRPAVKIRTGNDTTTKEKGLVTRLAMEFKGLYMIAEDLFNSRGQTEVFDAFLSAVSRYIRPRAVPPKILLKHAEAQTWREMISYMQKYPYTAKEKQNFDKFTTVNPLYFLRILINGPLHFAKPPLKKLRDKLQLGK